MPKELKLTPISKRNSVCEYTLAVDSKGNIYALEHSDHTAAITAKEIDRIAPAIQAVAEAKKAIYKVCSILSVGGEHALSLPDVQDVILVGCQVVSLEDFLKMHKISLKARR